MEASIETERLILRRFVGADVDRLFALHNDPEVMRFLTGRDPAEFELGYRLCKEAWGDGYAAEGSRALIGNAFAERGARRIWAQTMAVNSASRRVMEKSGLKFVRTFHLTFDTPLPGTELGEVEYALDRADWERQKPESPP